MLGLVARDLRFDECRLAVFRHQRARRRIAAVHAQVPMAGCQSLMAQNGPITDHTAEAGAAMSALRDNEAAEAAYCCQPPRQKRRALQRRCRCFDWLPGIWNGERSDNP